MDLPRIATPEFQPTATAMPALPPTPAEMVAKKKSENWLVDAMMKKPPSEPRLKENSPRSAPTGSAENEEAGARMQQAVPEPRFSPNEVNPLLRYMAGWMSPQDYALLKPGMSGEAAASLPGRGDPSLASLAPDAASLGDSGSALDLSTLAQEAHAAQMAPRQNPYLQAFAAPPPPAQSFVPPPVHSPAAAAADVFAPPPGPARSNIPDFAKPPEDEKYFKQLKRF